MFMCRVCARMSKRRLRVRTAFFDAYVRDMPKLILLIE